MIELDKSISDKLSSGMNSDGAVELPFPHAFLWAHNGQTSYKNQGGALYYGGWLCDSVKLSEAMEQQGLTLPNGWGAATIENREGGEFEAAYTRSVLIAPIAKRVSWLVDGTRSAEYVEGARRHVQILAYMAERKTNGDKSEIIPWGPVVLTAKGYQARNLLNAFSAWDKATSGLRRKVAPSVPAWCFYLAIGTFSNERKVLQVGKVGAQSPITPISAYIPDVMTEETITKLFVGETTAGIMVELLDKAQDWLAAWKGEAESISKNGHNTPTAIDDDFLVPDEDRPF